VNEFNPSGLFFSVVLILSIRRSRKKLKTFLLSIAVFTIVSFIVLLSVLILPANNDVALGYLAADTGRMAGAITAFIYSTKNREVTPQSVYLFALSCAMILLVW